MLCYIFLIAVILPALSRGESTNQTTCFSNANVTAGAVKIEKYFNETLESGWKPDTGKKFKMAYSDFIEVTAKTCNRSTEHRNTSDYLNILKHTFTSDYLADFVNNDGKKCVSSVKNKIGECVKKYVVDDIENVNANESKNIRNAILWTYSKLMWNSNACNITLKVKECTMEVIQNNNDCKPIQNFVADIFDGVHKNCEGIVEESLGTSDLLHVEEKPQKGANNSLVILLLVIIICGALYVLARDWRFNRLPCGSRGSPSIAEATPLSHLNQDHGTRSRPAI